MLSVLVCFPCAWLCFMGHLSSYWVRVCLLWVYVVIQHMMNSKWFQISTLWTSDIWFWNLFQTREWETVLTYWGRVTHTCIGKLTIIGSGNGLSPGRQQAIIWTSTVMLLTRALGTNFSEISIGIQTFSFQKMHLKMSFAKWRHICLSLSVLSNETDIMYKMPVDKRNMHMI